MKGSQPNAFVSFDFLFAILPILLILLYGFSVSTLLIEHSAEHMASQILFDKLVSVSDYVVRYVAVEKEISSNSKESKTAPNKISEEALLVLDIPSLEEKIGLSNLQISFEKGSGTCIFRLVMMNDEIKKLYFCEGYEYS